jgi:hypothetical protein
MTKPRPSHLGGRRGRLICERSLAFSGGLVRSEQFAQFKSFWVASTRADDAEIVLTQPDGEKASTS